MVDETKPCPACGESMELYTLGFGGGGRSFRYAHRCNNPNCELDGVHDEPCDNPVPLWIKNEGQYRCYNCGHPIEAVGITTKWEHGCSHDRKVE